MLLLVIIYLAFISLGLPDTVLGSAWPAISHDLNADLELAGIVSLVTSLGTVISSLCSTRAIGYFGTGKVVAISVLMTAIALLGFTFAQNVWLLALLAVPLGFGAGAVDAALNNFVAINYSAKHMNYLHSFWGVGATLGPLIMAVYLSASSGWREGYGTIAYIQFALVIVLLAALPLWRKATTTQRNATEKLPISEQAILSNRQAIKINGVKLQMVLFCCYSALEAGTGLWAASYLTVEKGIPITDAAFWTAMYFLGITVGRFLCGLIAERVGGEGLIRIGLVTILIGVIALLLPTTTLLAKFGLILIGLGCAPIYPNCIHLTPQRFGRQSSQAIISLSMASAYIGTLLLPPLMGPLFTTTSFAVFPLVLLLFSGVMFVFSERLKYFPEMSAQFTTEEPTNN